MGGSGKHRWRFSLNRLSFSSAADLVKTRPNDPPKEFLCPISGSLMFDPVVISSGQTYERTSAQVCRDLAFAPPLPDGTVPNFNALIPNLALRSAIINWCNTVGIQNPTAPDYYSTQNTVRTLMAASTIPNKTESELNIPKKGTAIVAHATAESNADGCSFCSTSSDESVIANVTEPSSITTRPSCFSGSSSTSNSVEILSEEEKITNPNSSSESAEEDFILRKLRSYDVFDHKEGLINLRKITRTNEEARVSLCTPPMLTAVRLALFSKYVDVQTNAAAAIVNLSLAKVNKVKIVRSGIVPPLIDLLKGGYIESQEHAAGALFSLAVEDDNRTAIGVLGALQPLVHALRSESERTRHDSASALYNLSLIQSNRVKLIKLGAVTTLLSLLENDDVAGRVLLVVCNVATCAEGKSAMLHCNAVVNLVKLLRKVSRVGSESTRENCLSALYTLSQGNSRFKGLAIAAGATEVFREVLEQNLSQLGREKTRIMLMILRGSRESGGQVDWDRVMKSGPSRNGAGVGSVIYDSNSTEFSFD